MTGVCVLPLSIKHCAILAILCGLAALPLAAQNALFFGLNGQGSGGGLSYTFSQVQLASSNGGCSSSSNTCLVTVSSTGSGNAGILLFAMGSAQTLSSVANGGTWVVPSGCQEYNATVGSSIGCAYTLNTTASATSIQATWSGSSPGSPAVITFYEMACSAGTPELDTGSSAGLGVVANTSASATQPGVALTVSGQKLATFQVEGLTSGAFSSIDTSYTGSDNNQSNNAMAHLYNTTSGAAPNWTNTLSSDQNGAAIAIRCH